jgi:hypothetical protein
VYYHLRCNRLALLVECHSTFGERISSFLKTVVEASGSISGCQCGRWLLPLLLRLLCPHLWRDADGEKEHEREKGYILCFLRVPGRLSKSQNVHHVKFYRVMAKSSCEGLGNPGRSSCLYLENRWLVRA